MAEEGRVEIGEASAGCKMEESMSNLGGAPVVCLVCDRVIKELHRQDVPNVFLENSVTSHSQQQLANMLSVILKSPLESSQVYSKTLCRRCFRLLDELDGIEQRSVVLKTTIEELYNRSLLRRMKGPRVNEEETIGAMDLGLPEDDEEDDGSKISVKVEPLDDDEDFLADELRPEDQGIRPDDPEFNPAHDNMWRSKSRSKGRGRGRGRSRGRARGRGRGRGPGRPPKNIKDEDATTSKAGESLGEKLGQLVNKILGDDESEEPVDMETETPTTSAGTEEEVDAAEKGEIGSLNVGSRHRVNRQCKWCDFSCPSPREMATHALTHGQHSCSECGLALARPSALKHHLKIVHNISLSSCDEKKASASFPCDECGKVYASAGGLHSHKLGTHSGRVYSCKECGREFNHPKNLASHVVRHSERNLKCTECSASFYLRSELNKHINQVHRKCRPYVCVDCGRSFCQRSVLKHHRMVHTDHRPLTCPICGRTFKHRHAFNYHLEQERKMAADSQEEGGQNNTALPSLMTVTNSTQTSEDGHTEEQAVNFGKVNSIEKISDFTILTTKTDRKFSTSIETKSPHMPLLASSTDTSDTHTPGHYSAVELFGSSATFAIDTYNQSQRSVMLVTDINQDHSSIASFVLGAEGATDISPDNFKEHVDSSAGIHATSGISTLPDVELGHTEITCTTEVGAGASRLDPEPTVSQYIKEGIEDCCVLSEDFISAYQATNAEVLTE